jgi:adenylate cyclase
VSSTSPPTAAPFRARELARPAGALAHGYDLGLLAYRAPVGLHALLAVYFLALRVPGLAAVNVAVLGTMALALRFHVRGHVVGAYAVSVVGAAVHAAAASWFVGWDTGYHLLLVPSCLVAAFTPGLGDGVRAAAFSAALGAWIVCHAAFSGLPPQHDLPSWWTRATWYGNALGGIAFIALWGKGLVRRLEDAESRAAEEHARSEALLANILPPTISERLKRGEEVSQAFDGISVLFADLVGFTPLSAKKTPAELVGMLDRLFSEMDALAERHGVEKIKTLGDAYMAASGLPSACDFPADRMAAFALDVVALFASQPEGEDRLRVRVGIATGPVVAGVIGVRKFAYDVWGDTVNTAARMESFGMAGRVHVEEATFRALGSRWTFEERGPVEVKGKGRIPTWYLVGKAD